MSTISVYTCEHCFKADTWEGFCANIKNQTFPGERRAPGVVPHACIFSIQECPAARTFVGNILDAWLEGKVGEISRKEAKPL